MFETIFEIWTFDPSVKLKKIIEGWSLFIYKDLE